ncbi:MAG TPA: flagellar biosynthesis protein FlhB [Burkholderiaceae bacterium]
MADQEQDRSEAATPYKLKQAQERGQVSKSQEAVFAAVLAGFVLVLFGEGRPIAQKELILMRQAIDSASHLEWSPDTTGKWLFDLLSNSLSLLTPFFLTIIVAAILGNVLQVGAIFSFRPIAPDFERINPAAGFKRLLSLTLLYNAAKSVFKLLALTWVLWIVLGQDFSRLVVLNQVDARAHAGIVMAQVPSLLFKLLLVMIALVLFDIGYTRWDYGKKMRMSRREVRDEHKQREGDPRIRSRMRQLRAEMLKQSRALRSVPDADVLITNPTHLAVALSYKHGEMPAPKMLAKGAGTVAAKMREIARQRSIPIVENPPLARAMYKRLKTGEFLPEDLYPMAAKILLWVYSLRAARASMAKQ